MFNLEWSLFARVRRQAKLSKRDAISGLLLLPPWNVGITYTTWTKSLSDVLDD
jgi:hypothetical protein